MSNFLRGCKILVLPPNIFNCHRVDCLEDSHDMRDHEKHGKLNVFYFFEYDLNDIQSLVLVEEELEFPLEDGCPLFEEVHDSTTLEPTYVEFFSFLREVHVLPLWSLHMMNIFHFLILWVSWFFFLHPTLPYFAAFILMK